MPWRLLIGRREGGALYEASTGKGYGTVDDDVGGYGPARATEVTWPPTAERRLE